MNEITDEKVALALGWHHEYWTNKKYKNWYTPPSTPKRWGCPGLPHWTTSMDVILAEIEKLNLGIHLVYYFTDKLYRVSISNGKEDCPMFGTKQESATLALCEVFLKYLKEFPPEIVTYEELYRRGQIK